MAKWAPWLSEYSRADSSVDNTLSFRPASGTLSATDPGSMTGILEVTRGSRYRLHNSSIALLGFEVGNWSDCPSAANGWSKSLVLMTKTTTSALNVPRERRYSYSFSGAQPPADAFKTSTFRPLRDLRRSLISSVN